LDKHGYNWYNRPKTQKLFESLGLEPDTMLELIRQEKKYNFEFAGCHYLAGCVAKILDDKTKDISAGDIQEYLKGNNLCTLGEIAKTSKKDEILINSRQLSMSRFMTCLSLAGTKESVAQVLGSISYETLDLKLKIISKALQPICLILKQHNQSTTANNDIKSDLTKYTDIIQQAQLLLPQNNIESLDTKAKQEIACIYVTIGETYQRIG
jgi:hypothetical protein